MRTATQLLRRDVNLRRELVNRAVVVIAPMGGGAVEATGSINHAAIGESRVGRTLEKMRQALNPAPIWSSS